MQKILLLSTLLFSFRGVGKTSLIVRYVMKSFIVNPTIGASFFTCKLNLDDTKIKLQVWDTAGQERFRSMAPMYYRNANAAMLVFDITDYASFEMIKNWVSELRRNVEEAMVLAVIGNKSDLARKRQVDSEEGRSYATTINATYHETSALQNEGIDDVFLSIAAGLVKLSSGQDLATSLRVYESTSSGMSNNDMPPSPSSEESPENVSIAHGIHEKPLSCC